MSGSKKGFKRTLEFGRQIDKDEGKRIVRFCEKYLAIYKDNFLRQRYEQIVARRFMPKSFFDLAKKRSVVFSVEELEDRNVYIIKYGVILPKLLVSAKRTSSYYREKVVSLLEFYKNYGYLTFKQRTLVSAIFDNKDVYFSKLSQFRKEAEVLIFSHLLYPPNLTNPLEKKIDTKKEKTFQEKSFSLNEMRRQFELT